MNRRELLLAVGAVTLGGCATLRPGFVQPSVTLNSLRMLPEGGAGPRFALSLRIINPNRFELALRGLSYEVELDGFKLITGVTADVSPVPPYGESLVEVQSGVDLLAGARLINRLVTRSSQEALDYVLRTRLDVDGSWHALTHKARGEIALADVGSGSE